MINDIESFLTLHLKECLPQHKFKDVLEYAVLPAGKLFRPQLVMALAADLKESKEDHKYLASSIELHHAYTLIHDDLPAMDDDDIRRGRASTHKKFNEANAILAGDALLNYSYEILANIEAKYLPELLKLYGATTGPKGLILGQVMDLEESLKDFDDIIKIHSLKTSCLIQLALQGSNILSDSKIPRDDTMRLGYSLGVVFQLLDDLSELSDDINEHEKEINPFLQSFQDDAICELSKSILDIKKIIQSHSLKNIDLVINSYLNKMKNKIEKNKSKISKTVPKLESVINMI